jgi:spermidine synthase
VVAALYLATKSESTVSRNARVGLLAATAAVALAIVAWPKWDIGRWTAGIYRLSMTREYYPNAESFEPAKVIFHKDGMHSTVTVEEDQDVIWIKVGGKVDGSSYGDMPTQVLSGLLPMMLHPNPKQIAVIGCGTGVTVGAALQGEPERVTLIELEGAVLEGAKLFEDVNHAPWADPRLTIVEDDGRNFLRRGTSQFDVIISEPSNPWMTGAASLFTREFFQIAEKRLKDDGLFLQWLQIYELAPERIQSVLKTFNSVFPHVNVFTAHVDSNDLLMVGSKKPLKIEWETLARRFVTWAPELERAQVTTVEELLALLLVNETAFASVPESIELNTDDNALVEFGAPRDLLNFAESDPELPFLQEMRGKLHTVVRDLVITRDLPWEQRAVQMARGYIKQGMLADAIAVLDSIDAKIPGLDPASATDARIYSEIAHLLLEEDNVVVLDEHLITTDKDYAQIAKLTLEGKEEKALEVFKKRPELSQRGPLHALLHGYLAYLDGDLPEARAVLKRADEALADAEQPPAIAYYLAREAYRDGEYGRAFEQMNRYRAAITRSLSPSASAD